MATKLLPRDVERQLAAAGLERGLSTAYHPWFPVLCIGVEKANLYMKAIRGDVAAGIFEVLTTDEVAALASSARPIVRGPHERISEIAFLTVLPRTLVDGNLDRLVDGHQPG